MNRRRLVALGVAVLAVLLCGCTTLPTAGQVHTRPDDAGAAATEAPYFAPPGPISGDTREGVVRGFLLAMQANPPSTAVAREFLSGRARTNWKPVQGTIVYDASTVDSSGGQVYARLSGAHRLDPSGAWVTERGQSNENIGFTLVREGGEWRIDNPPNALAVPSSYFSSLFVPFSLYFFDRTGTVLVPTRVYLPRGEQTASNLVRGLLAGPGNGLTDVLSSAFGPHTDLDLAVVVNDAGVAEVPLSPDIRKLSAGDLSRAVAQLAWTLRQVPGVNRLRLSVDGETIPLPDGQSDVSVNADPEFDATTTTDRDLVGIADKRVVRIATDEATPVGGPFGRAGFALRSVALDAVRHRLAVVASNGRRVYLASDRGSRAPQLAQTVLSAGTDVLRPAFDRFGGLWLVDRTARGAVVHLVAGGHSRMVTVPGISGRAITAFMLTRDGTELVAAPAGSGSPRLLVSALVRNDLGGLVEAHAASLVDLGGEDLGVIRDLAQAGGTTIAVLNQPSRGSGRISILELDGSPGEPGAITPDVVPGAVLGLAAGPDPDLPMRVVTEDGQLLTLITAGQWVRSSLADVTAATYPQ